MSSKYKFTSLVALVLSSCLLIACSSSTSSSGGSGQIPTGTYNGTFSGAINEEPFNVAIDGRISIIANVTGSTTAMDGTTTAGSITVSGNLAVTGHSFVNSGVRCFTGGTINTANSSVNGNQMVLDITLQDGGILTMTGRTTDDNYNGTFSADDSNCSGLSGNFRFNRI